MKKRTHVAGGKVTKGEVAMNALVRVTRGGADVVRVRVRVTLTLTLTLTLSLKA